jgi:hypothetical protein
MPVFDASALLKVDLPLSGLPNYKRIKNPTIPME